MSRGQGCHNAQDTPLPQHTQRKISQAQMSLVLRLRSPGPGTRAVGPWPRRFSWSILSYSPEFPLQTFSILFKLLPQLPPPSDSTLSFPAFNYTELSSLPDAIWAPHLKALAPLLPPLPTPFFLELSASRLFKEAVPRPLTRRAPLLCLPQQHVCSSQNRHHTNTTC